MTKYRLSGVVVGVICLVLIGFLIYGLYSDCPDTAVYVFCEKKPN